MELSFLEMIAVATIALLVLGPEELIRQSQRLGRFIGKLRTQANNFRVMVESEANLKSFDTPKISTKEIPSDSATKESSPDKDHKPKV